jgi:hypothetical protein
MYVQTLEGLGLGLGQPQPPRLQQPAIRKKYVSNVVAYKDTKNNCQSTNCSIYVPSALRNPKAMDVLVFFHGLLPICDSAHNFDPDRLIKKFQMDVQVDTAPQLALAVPIVLWNTDDRRFGIIQAAWSAAYLNAFVEEVLDQIGKSYGIRPQLGRLILAGHSAAYDILTPLAEQFECGVAETRKGALAKLERVVAMDTTYRLRDAKALEQWARNVATVQFNLVLSKSDPSVAVWQGWEKTRRNTTGQNRPTNLRVFHNLAFGHCDLPANFLITYI